MGASYDAGPDRHFPPRNLAGLVWPSLDSRSCCKVVRRPANLFFYASSLSYPLTETNASDALGELSLPQFPAHPLAASISLEVHQGFELTAV
jgi:hypothetical protein